jgi:hypothetical protein
VVVGEETEVARPAPTGKGRGKRYVIRESAQFVGGTEVELLVRLSCSLTM